MTAIRSADSRCRAIQTRRGCAVCCLAVCRTARETMTAATPKLANHAHAQEGFYWIKDHS